MREPPPRILDELSRAVNGALGVASGLRREAHSALRAHIESILRDADVVSRDEFEALRAMAIAARDENDRLNARLAALEAALPSAK